MRKRYIINLISLKVEETKLTKGLQLNRKGFAYGFVMEGRDLVSATDELNKVEVKWREWISDYNTWVGTPEKERAKYKRKVKA